jgi:hypothetical protein
VRSGIVFDEELLERDRIFHYVRMAQNSEADALESRRANAKAANTDVGLQPEALHSRATRQQAVGSLRYGGVAQGEALELGEVQVQQWRRYHLGGREVTAAELGGAECGSEVQRGGW